MPEQPAAISYFLSQTGSKTRRIAGPPGKGHIELAKEILGELHEPIGQDLYASMFKHGYIRVMEDGDTVYIDSPRGFSRAQRDFAIEQEKDGKTVVVNSHIFAEMRQKFEVEHPGDPAVVIVERMIRASSPRA
jgi:hypothetical protein